MKQKEVSWISAFAVGLVFFIFWKFFLASPGHLDRFGLLNSKDFWYLILGTFLAMLSSSVFIIASPSKPNAKFTEIISNCFRLFVCFLVMMPRIQLNAWFCWTKKTFLQWMVYTYNTARDEHYLKAIDMNQCPQDLLQKGKLMNDIEIERLHYELLRQDSDCNNITNTIIVVLIVLYIFFCNIVPRMRTREPSYSYEKEPNYHQKGVRDFTVPSNTREDEY